MVDAPSITRPAEQEILTNGSAYTVQVSAPDDASVGLYYNGALLGAMTNAGGGNWTYSWTPGAVDYAAYLYATGNVSGQGATRNIPVAEANLVTQTLTSWSRLGVAVLTGSQSDPYGGTSAYKVTCNAGTGQRGIFIATAATAALGGYEVWFKPAGNMTVFATQTTGATSSAYYDTATGQTQSNKVSIACVEQRNGWYRMWVKIETNASPYTTLYFQASTTLGLATPTTTTSDIFYLYAPRTMDNSGVPMKVAQRLVIYLASTSGGVETWTYKHPYVEVAADMGSSGYTIQVIKPSGWANDGLQTGVVMLPPLFDSQEAPGTTPKEVAIAADYANTYNCVIVIPNIKTGQFQWFGKKDTGDADYHGWFVEAVVPWMRAQLGVNSDQSKLGLLGYSKSANAGLSFQLRNPDIFGAGVYFDGVWNIDANWITQGTDYFAATMFGTQAQYQLYDPYTLMPTTYTAINDKTRVGLIGWHTFPTDFDVITARLDAYGVAYEVNDYDTGGHSWASGWLDEGFATLFDILRTDSFFTKSVDLGIGLGI